MHASSVKQHLDLEISILEKKITAQELLELSRERCVKLEHMKLLQSVGRVRSTSTVGFVLVTRR